MSSWWYELVNGFDRPAFAGAAAALALVALAHAALTWWVRRTLRDDDVDGASSNAAAGFRRWIPRVVDAIASPIALLIWVAGLYFVLRGLLPRVTPASVTGPSIAALGWVFRLGVVCGLVWLLARIGALVERILTSLASRMATSWDDLLLPLAGKAARRGLPLVALILSRPVFAVSPALAEVVANATSLFLIGVIAFVLYEIVDSAAAFILRQHRIDVAENLRARSIYTQVTVLKKVAFATIFVFALASMLMVFESVRQFGASILASAGIAGIVLGFAAQRSIATLLAGFQIALTQPIRVDDVVIVENEWGRIEELTLTYVVVRIWDLRRLVVPINYFIEQPFQNWTRSSSNVIGTVFLHVDYSMPIEPLRAELTRILAGSKRWDGKVNVLQVTDAREHTMELRALVSAADAGLAWDLRCDVREQLVAFVQREYPACLPRFRAMLDERPLMAAAASA